VRAISKKEILEIRSPNATRPWQHVLESLSGYLCLGQKLIEGKKEFAEAWNFGPNDSGNRTVEEVLSHLKKKWSAVNWRTGHRSQQPHEATLLHLDSAKSRQRLSWQPVWSFDESLEATSEWYKANIEREAVISLNQLKAYTTAARQAGYEWSGK
jgi:CDP-glucose 4,6-dehydratase